MQPLTHSYRVLFVMLACLASTAALFTQETPVVPKGAVVFFDAPTCPDGWSTYWKLRGRLVVGTVENDQIGATVGGRLTDREDRKHTHDFSIPFRLNDRSITFSHPGSNKSAASYFKNEDNRSSPKKDYKAAGTTKSSTSGLPFVQLAACTLDATGDDDSMPPASALFFAGEGCPAAGWEAVDAADGYLVIPAPQPELIGEFAGQPLGAQKNARHSHFLRESIDPKSTTFRWAAAGEQQNLAKASERFFSGDTESDEVALPYVQLVLCSKMAVPSDPSTAPEGMLFFTAQETCPAGTPEEKYAGRVLVGLPNGATSVATFGGPAIDVDNLPAHKHEVQDKVKLTWFSIAADSGNNSRNYARAGSPTFKGKTDWGHSGFGLYFLLQCRVGGS